MLEAIVGRTFQDTTLSLDGVRFVRCRFVNAQLIYTAREETDFEECTFDRCSWTFEGPAENMIAFLSILQDKVTPDGPELVEAIFKSIRNGKVAELRADAMVA